MFVSCMKQRSCKQRTANQTANQTNKKTLLHSGSIGV